MISWKIDENGYDSRKAINLGNKFLTGNGYMGIRGTLEEYTKEQFPAVNLAGIYDQTGNGWREPLNAPNGLYTRLLIEGDEYSLPEKDWMSHKMALNYRYGLFGRETVFQTKKGNISLQTERFASMEEKHLIVLKTKLTPSFDGEVEVITGIDADVWDINGPHYDSVDTGSLNECLYALGTTHENQDQVVVFETVGLPGKTDQMVSSDDRKVTRYINIPVKAGGQYSLYKYIAVYTSKDCKNYKAEAEKLVLKAKEAGYEQLLSDHKSNWEEKWKVSEVSIEGDDEAMEALNYSLYHLHSIAPRHSESLSIAARGLSGQTYKGAVFWDTEMFMLDFFLFTEPQVAKTLLKYRIDTLPGARKKAESYGFDGAFYAWESQEGGYDACSDYNVTDVFTGRPMRTYFKDKQIHISAAVVYGIMRYTLFTGKRDLLSEGGAEVILECAKFYYSLLIRRIKEERYELWDVIGPDEYHERVNNNAYTNRMAKYTFDAAVEVLKEKMAEGNENSAQKKELLERLEDAAKHLYIPEPDEKTGIIEQFDGYELLEEVSIAEVKERLLHEKEYWGGAYGVASHTKIIKQADVVTMINLFSNEYDVDTLYKNWSYYEPRTEHGSSLSACMYSMLACKCGMADNAYPFFIKSAVADLLDGGKQWAGLIYIGGTHPAASGGAYMTAVEGFAGLRIEDGELKASPRLPAAWNKLSFNVYYQGDLYQIIVTKEEAQVKKCQSDITLSLSTR